MFKRGNKGITLIALIITIIVLLILAGVTIAQITGQDSAPQKAADSKVENEKGEAKDEATMLASQYVQEYMEKRYVQNIRVEETTSNVQDKKLEVGQDGNSVYSVSGIETPKMMTDGEETIPAIVGDYVAQQFSSRASQEGAYNYSTSGRSLTVKTKSNEDLVTGTINDDGTITWSDTATGKIDNGEGTWIGSVTIEEETALAANGMAKLADSDVPSNLKTDSIKAVLSGNVPVPAGYTYKEGTSTALASAPISWGVVIEDGDHNEWVWVPVNETESIAPSEMYETIEPKQIGEVKQEENDIQIGEEKQGIKLASVNGIESLLKVADSSSSSSSLEDTSIYYTVEYYKDGRYDDTEYCSSSYDSITIYENDFDSSRYDGYYITATEPSLPCDISDGDVIKVYYEEVDEDRRNAKSVPKTNRSVDFLEPEIVKYDVYEEYYTQAEFSSATELARALVSDYDKMLNSVKKYGGFYIGRYEICGNIDNPQIKKNMSPICDKNWYELYKANKKLGKNTTTSSMIWSVQWNIVCNWARDNGDKVPLDTNERLSEHYGAYLSGNISNDKRNNIYDLGGNLCEWTQAAAYDYERRVCRGGNFGERNEGNAWHINTWAGTATISGGTGIGSRPTLCIK